MAAGRSACGRSEAGGWSKQREAAQQGIDGGVIEQLVVRAERSRQRVRLFAAVRSQHRRQNVVAGAFTGQRHLVLVNQHLMDLLAGPQPDLGDFDVATADKAFGLSSP